MHHQNLAMPTSPSSNEGPKVYSICLCTFQRKPISLYNASEGHMYPTFIAGLSACSIQFRLVTMLMCRSTNGAGPPFPTTASTTKPKRGHPTTTHFSWTKHVLCFLLHPFSHLLFILILCRGCLGLSQAVQRLLHHLPCGLRVRQNAFNDRVVQVHQLPHGGALFLMMSRIVVSCLGIAQSTPKALRSMTRGVGKEGRERGREGTTKWMRMLYPTAFNILLNPSLHPPYIRTSAPRLVCDHLLQLV